MKFFNNILDILLKTITNLFPEEQKEPNKYSITYRDSLSNFIKVYEQFSSTIDYFNDITDKIIKHASKKYLEDMYRKAKATSPQEMFLFYKKNAENMERFDEIRSGYPESTIKKLRYSQDWTKLITIEVIGDLFIFLKYSTEILLNKNNEPFQNVIKVEDIERFQTAVRNYVTDGNVKAIKVILKLNDLIEAMKKIINYKNDEFKLEPKILNEIQDMNKIWNSYNTRQKELKKRFGHVYVYKNVEEDTTDEDD